MRTSWSAGCDRAFEVCVNHGQLAVKVVAGVNNVVP